MLKTLGCLISILSVLMLGAVSWKATEADMALRLCLLAGVATSVLGMFLRWLSFLEERRKAPAWPGDASSQSTAYPKNRAPA
jgi:hypothetical protein